MAYVAVSARTGYEQRAEYECWPWLNSCDPGGYGQAFNHRLGRVDKAHRVVYELRTGKPLPPRSSGLELDHLCRNRKCVNPAHLELVTIQVNRARRPRQLAPIPHGTTRGYGRHCRCDACRTAWSAYLRSRRQK